jgi:hypothetical protein
MGRRQAERRGGEARSAAGPGERRAGRRREGGGGGARRARHEDDDVDEREGEERNLLEGANGQATSQPPDFFPQRHDGFLSAGQEISPPERGRERERDSARSTHGSRSRASIAGVPLCTRKGMIFTGKKYFRCSHGSDSRKTKQNDMLVHFELQAACFSNTGNIKPNAN